jgi:hypothetical protein
MKIHDLQKQAGTAMVWPPQWVESSGPGHTSAVAEEGVPEGLADHDQRRPAHGQHGVGSASSRGLVNAAGYAVEAVRCR